MRPRVLIIAGPTGVGKSEAAVLSAEELDGEIISADSRQVYRGLEIGTAAPGRELLQRVPHHLVSTRDPRQSWSAGDLALTDGLFEEPPADPGERERVRAGLEARLREEGVEALWTDLAALDPAWAEGLAALDPAWAEGIPATDTQRVIRGLEIHALHGVPLTELQQNQECEPFCDADWTQVLLERDRDLLYRRLNERVTALFDEGWPEEAYRLRSDGVPVDAPGLTGLGYDLLYRHLDGELSREETIEGIRKEHRNYAKRQLTWFRNFDAHRVRLGPDDGPEQTAARILTCWRN